MVVITGIKRAISLLINVENVSVWTPKDKGPTGLFPPASSLPSCREPVLVSLELPEQWVLGVGSVAINSSQECVC